MSRFTEWTLAQACLWIGSKDEVQVAALRLNHSFAELAAAAELDRHDNIGRADQPDWIVAAQMELLAAARAGIARDGLEITGQPSNGDPRSVVPPKQCTRIFRGRKFPGTYETLLSETEAECLGQPGGVYWTELRVQADDVRRLWPAVIEPAAEPEPVAEPAAPAQAEGNARDRPRKVGKPGAGNVPYNSDDDLVERALKGMEEHKYKSANAAAWAMVEEIEGGGGDESRVRRLAAKIRKADPSS